MDNTNTPNDNTPGSLTLFDTIKKYPFNGRSKYLIDKFYIIGYDNLTLNKLLFKSNIRDLIYSNKQNISVDEDYNEFMGVKKEAKGLKSIIIDEVPSLLNEISSDYSKPVPDIDLIIDMIFPNKPKFYYHCSPNEKSDLPNEKFEGRSSKLSSFSRMSVKSDGIKNKHIINIPETYNVVFSSNPQEGNNSKKSINGFALVFYRILPGKKLFEDNFYRFFVPTVFCIISEFPFFNSYYLLCNQILNFFKNKKVDIPLEILLYNIINSCPSPINGDVYLNLEPFTNVYDRVKIKSELNNDFYESIKEEENDELLDVNIDNSIKYGSQKNLVTVKKKLKKENAVKERKENINVKLDNDSNFSSFSVVYKKTPRKSDSSMAISRASILKDYRNKDFKDIKFGCLSGYPLIQYNLAKVLLKLDPQDVITIFIYTFLEKTVIFFSKNIELLSLTINSYLNLNFPLNDEKYYFFNACTSFENYMNGNSYFLGTAFTSIIGINDKYNSKYLSSNHVKLSEHLVVDLDRNIIKPIKNNKSNEDKDKILLDFLDKIYYNKGIDSNEKNTILYTKIKSLYDKLCYYKEFFTEKKIKKNKENENIKKILNGGYLDYDDHEYSPDKRRKNDDEKDNDNCIIKKTNYEIQESFYTLINNLCMYFYQNLNLRVKEDDYSKNKKSNNKFNKEKDSMKVIFDEDIEIKYSKEENAFLDELRETMKFQSFVYGFIQSYNPIDLYKIPLSFTEEFISILRRKNIHKDNILFFQLIDRFYKKNSNQSIYIEYSKLINDDFLKVRNFIDREIYDQFINNKSKNSIEVKTRMDGEFEVIDSFKYKNYELNNDILFKFKNYISNLKKKEYEKLFYYSHYIDANLIKSIKISEIESEIEKCFMANGILTKNDICYCNIILLFIMSIQSNISTFECQLFLNDIFRGSTIFRKYYSMIIDVLYKLTKNCMEEKKYALAEKYFLCYYLCINSLRESQLVPNESLLTLIKNFDEINLDDLHQKLKENSNINDNNNENVDENLVYNPEYIYISNNFNKDHFYKEKFIVDKCNASLDGKSFVTKHKNKIRQPIIKFNNGKFKYECKIANQYKILELLSKQYLVFQVYGLNINLLDIKNVFDSCLNISIFIRNNDEFKGKEELIELFNKIFTFYLNLLYKSMNNNQ